MLENFLRPAFFAPAALVVGYLLYEVWRSIWGANLPNLPIAGSRSSDWLPLLQARWRNTTQYRYVADELKTRYKDKPCLVPIGGSETVCLLPASETQHIMDQPDAVLNMPLPIIEGLQFRYTIVDQVIIEEPLHQKLISTTLTHQIPALVADVLDETVAAFEKYWGLDKTEFKDIAVYDTMRHIIGSATNRAAVGLPFCRDPALVDAAMSYAAALPNEARRIRMYPQFLKPLVAPFITDKTKLHTKEFYDILLPEIRRRVREYDLRQEDPKAAGLGPEPNDFLQWSLAQAKAHPDPRMAEPSTLAGRILMLNFAAIHTASFTATFAIFDLVSSDPGHMDELRDEVSSVLAEAGGKWSKKVLSRMEKLDSTLRESLRLNMTTTFGIPRLVIGKDGFTTRSGVHISKGNVIAVPGENIAKDEEFYPDAATYKPFRFAEKRRDESVGYIKRAREAAPTTTPDFLPFGLGRHACPGRFFATSELKLILAYMIWNYDIEPLDKRPDNIFAGPSKLPPLASTIRVRRREN